MAYFAQINKRSIVVQVIVSEKDFIDLGRVGDSLDWIEVTNATGYPATGYLYDRANDYFQSTRPYPSWEFNKAKKSWESPVKMPNPVKGELGYMWDENSRQWLTGIDTVK